jgi:hypothetical protein
MSRNSISFLTEVLQNFAYALYMAAATVMYMVADVWRGWIGNRH